MAEFADTQIKLKTHALMTYGDKPYQPGNGNTLLVVEKNAGSDKDYPDEVDAHGFDMGTLRRDCFDSREAAQEHLHNILSGRYKLNQFRKIDPNKIMLKDLVFEVYAIDFNDREREIMSLMGALDHMSSDEKFFFNKVFPDLVDTVITPPPLPPYDTHDGNPSAISTYTFVLASVPLRNCFNDYANQQAQSVRLSAVEVANNLRKSISLYNSLPAVAEEIGKSRIGLLEQDYSHILFMRLYDYNTTYAPEPKRERPPKPTEEERAMTILSQQDPIVIETILEAMKLRNIRPFSSGFKQKEAPGLPMLDLACK